MTLKGTNPFYHEHVLCHDPSEWFVRNLSDGMGQVDFTNLSSILTLHVVDCIVYMWLYLIIDLSHCTRWPLTLEEAVLFQGEPQIRSKGANLFQFMVSDPLAFAWCILTILDWDLRVTTLLPWDAWFFWLSWIDLISSALIIDCLWMY